MSDTAGFDGSVVPVRKALDVQLTEDEELALYDPSGAGLVVLNASSSAVWQLCDGTATLDEILAALIERYDADPVTLRADVWRTHGKLLELGLLETGATSGPATKQSYADEEAPAPEGHRYRGDR